MPLELAQLLDDPGLGLELVAGHAGLSTRGPVRWAHASELPDPTPWLEGGEILLTTGLGVKDSPELQRRLIAGLDERGCAGVGFGVGVVLENVPEAMLAEADARRLPLFTVPYEVPFIAVAKRVSHHTSAEHYATLRRAIDLHRRVLAAVVADTGVAGVLSTITASMPEFAGIVYDYYGQVLATHGGPLDADALWEVVTRQREGDRFELGLGNQIVTGSAVRVGDQIEAVLALAGQRPLHEHEALLLEQGITGVSLELARGLSVREARRARVDELLEEAATHRASPQLLDRQLARLGFDARRGYQVLCLRRPARVSERVLCALAEDVLAATEHPVLGRRDGDIYCIASPEGDQAERLAAAARARGWSGVVVARSRPKHDLDDLAAALREAAVAAETPASASGDPDVRDVGALGLVGLLAGVEEDLGAQAFVTAVLGRVLDYDARESGCLVPSLRAYLRHGCRPGPAAAELRVHRHTLAYRLDRIRDLTGRDPRDGRHLLEFGLALELHARSEASG